MSYSALRKHGLRVLTERCFKLTAMKYVDELQLALSDFSKWRASTISNSPKNRRETGIFAEGNVEIKDTDNR